MHFVPGCCMHFEQSGIQQITIFRQLIYVTHICGGEQKWRHMMCSDAKLRHYACNTGRIGVQGDTGLFGCGTASLGSPMWGKAANSM